MRKQKRSVKRNIYIEYALILGVMLSLSLIITPSKTTGFATLTSTGAGGSPVAATQTTYSWNATDPAIGHIIGSAEGTAWSADVTADNAGFLNYGPYIDTLDDGVSYQVTWSLMIDVHSVGTGWSALNDKVARIENDKVARIEIYDFTNNTLLVKHDIYRKDFLADFTYQDFSLNFTASSGRKYEFRTWWYDTAYIRLEKISVAPVPVSIGTGLVAYYKFDEGRVPGNTILDSSGNGNNGVNYGASQTTGILGSALQFGGVSSYVEVPNSAGLNPNQFTVEFWMRPTTLPPKYSTNLLSHGYPGMYWFELRDYGDLDFYATDSSGNYIPVSSGGGYISAGNWYHVAGTFDGKTMKFYINGNLVGTATLSGIKTDTNNILIGTGKGSIYGSYFNGAVDEVKVWNRVLTAAEINAEYTGKTTFLYGCTESSLMGDIDSDGFITEKDANITTDIILGKIPKPSNICCIDLNKNNAVDIGDVQKIIDIAQGLYPSPGMCSSVTTPSANCTDSDGGRSYFVRGTTSGFAIYNHTLFQNLTDKCDPNDPYGKNLFEYRCTDNYFDSETYTCPNGCSDGACLTNVTNATTCTDTDGGINYYAKGTIRYFYNVSTDQFYGWHESEDSCLDNATLAEYSCDFYTPTTLFPLMHYNCPNGCKDGACISSNATTCTDSDGGLNYYVKGTASNGTLVGTDSCQETPGWVNEYYCLGSELAGTGYKCPNGCKDGACISSNATTCTDTDGGINYNVKGNIFWYNSSGRQILTAKQPITVNVGGVLYSVTLNGVIGSTTAVISVISVGSEMSEIRIISKGNAYTIGGLNLYLEDVYFYSTTNQTFNQAKLIFGGITAVTDTCTNSVTLAEYYCNNDGGVSATYYECPGACSNGTCVSSSNNTTKGAMKISVVDSVNNSIIYTANVSISDKNGNLIGPVDTSSGSAVFTNLNPVGYLVLVKAPGYNSAMSNFTVLAGVNGYLTIPLERIITLQKLTCLDQYKTGWKFLSCPSCPTGYTRTCRWSWLSARAICTKTFETGCSENPSCGDATIQDKKECNKILKSDFFENDSFGMRIVSGEITDYSINDMPFIYNTSDFNKFAYKVISGLRQLGYSIDTHWESMLNRFEKKNGLPQSSIVSRDVLLKLDENLYTHENLEKPLSIAFPLYNRFTEKIPPNEPNRDHLVYLYSIGYNALPPWLVYNETPFTFEMHFLNIPGNVYKVNPKPIIFGQFPNYKYSDYEYCDFWYYGEFQRNCVMKTDLFLIPIASDESFLAMFFHEYGHSLDIDKTGFYNISFYWGTTAQCLNNTLNNTLIYTYTPHRNNTDIYDFISMYAAQGTVGDCGWKGDPEEDFAEHFAEYISEGVAFRTIAEMRESEGHPSLMQKYNWLKQNVFRGREYQTGTSNQTLILQLFRNGPNSNSGRYSTDDPNFIFEYTFP